jgi:hypothetical protein
MKLVSFGAAHPIWRLLAPDVTPEWLGYIPSFLRVDDDRPAKVQLNERYNRLAGASWRKTAAQFTLSPHGLKSQSDPMMRVLAECQLGDENIRLYEGSWVAVIQPDGAFEVSRMD